MASDVFPHPEPVVDPIWDKILRRRFRSLSGHLHHQNTHLLERERLSKSSVSCCGGSRGTSAQQHGAKHNVDSGGATAVM